MGISSVDQISRLLESIRQLTGCSVFLKKASGEPIYGMTYEHSVHENEYCLAVKDRNGCLQLCQANDGTSIPEKAMMVRAPFLNSCHAGLVELIVPVFRQKEYFAAIMLGPVRHAGVLCPYAELQDSFELLPLYDKDTFNAAQEILCLVAADITDHLELIIHHERQCIPSEKVRHAEHYIEQHCHESGFCAEVVAQAVFLSCSRFLHLFKERKGQSFSSYVTKVRMRKAEQLLCDTEFPVGVICREVGITNESYFCSVFKKSFGLTPAKYRAAHSR